MNITPPTQQQVLDNDHLRLLSIFHYVFGGITAFFSCIPIIHVVLGLLFILAPEKFGHGGNQPPPEFIGFLFVIVGGAVIILGWTFSALVVIAGRCIASRTHYTFCFVMACIECLSVPFGTVLGVFTILVLNRPSVKELFKHY
jgi:hypothetical protein